MNAEADEQRVRSRYADLGQEKVFRCWHRLDAAQRRQLIAQAAAFNLEELLSQWRAHEGGEGETRADSIEMVPQRWETEAVRRDYRDLGTRLIRGGRVAVILAASPRGTAVRPMSPAASVGITPVLNKSTFQIFAERILATGGNGAGRIPLVVATSGIHLREVERFFVNRDHFGLDPDIVRFLAQPELPLLDREGDLVLAAPDCIAAAPQGVGALFRSLRDSGCLGWLAARGVEVVSLASVDNPLFRPLEPELLGRLRRMGWRWCVRPGRSELPFAGENLYEIDAMTSGGIGRYRFLATKTPAPVSPSGEPAAGRVVRAFRAEESFSGADNRNDGVVLESGDAGEEQGLWGNDGRFDPESVRRHQARVFAGWASSAGAEIDNAGEIRLEVSPFFAETEEEFRRVWRRLLHRGVIADGTVFS